VPLGSPACSSALHVHAFLSRLVEALAWQTKLTHCLATAMAWDHILNPVIIGSPPSTPLLWSCSAGYGDLMINDVCDIAAAVDKKNFTLAADIYANGANNPDKALQGG